MPRALAWSSQEFGCSEELNCFKFAVMDVEIPEFGDWHAVEITLLRAWGPPKCSGSWETGCDPHLEFPGVWVF